MNRRIQQLKKPKAQKTLSPQSKLLRALPNNGTSSAEVTVKKDVNSTKSAIKTFKKTLKKEWHLLSLLKAY